MKLEVKHDTYEYPVIVNGVECDYCHELEHADVIHSIGDTDMCESCYQGMVE